MPRHYRHPTSKRIIPRRGNGRFRVAELRDMGLIACPSCGLIVAVAPVEVNGFVDPATMQRPSEHDCQSARPLEQGEALEIPLHNYLGEINLGCDVVVDKPPEQGDGE